VLAAYEGEARLVEALENNQARPLSLASADFDEDGVLDLVSGYAGPGGGIATLLRGNVDSIYPNAPGTLAGAMRPRNQRPAVPSPASMRETSTALLTLSLRFTNIVSPSNLRASFQEFAVILYRLCQLSPPEDGDSWHYTSAQALIVAIGASATTRAAITGLDMNLGSVC
jgi:hypothetical protein